MSPISIIRYIPSSTLCSSKTLLISFNDVRSTRRDQMDCNQSVRNGETLTAKTFLQCAKFHCCTIGSESNIVETGKWTHQFQPKSPECEEKKRSTMCERTFSDDPTTWFDRHGYERRNNTRWRFSRSADVTWCNKDVDSTLKSVARDVPRIPNRYLPESSWWHLVMIALVVRSTCSNVPI